MWRQIFLGSSRLSREIQSALGTRCFFCSLGANRKRDKSYNSKCLHGVDPQRTKHRPLCGFSFQESCPISKKQWKMQKLQDLCVWNQLHLSYHVTAFRCDLFSLSFRFYSMSISTSLCAKKLLSGVFSIFNAIIKKPQVLYTNTQTRQHTVSYLQKNVIWSVCVSLSDILTSDCGIILQAVSPPVFIYGSS